MNQRLVIFFLVFTCMNLVFVPLLSLYGLRVCPVLSIPGFGFGCYYSGLFIGITALLNFGFILFLNSKVKMKIPDAFKDPRRRIWVYTGTYLAGTLFALVLLQFMLHLNHLTTQSRGPEILTLASLLLGVTQAYGLNWALDGRSAREASEQDQSGRDFGFQKLWASHIVRMLLPVVLVAAVLLHFLISQSEVFNEGRIAPLASHDDLIQQTSYVVSFLLLWLGITFSFHFLSEKDHVNRVQRHLDRLSELDFNSRSDLGEAWGLWAAILNQLNHFSKVLGERSRLLKTFSRFVTAGVAERAMNQELSATGITRELTVMMSDIRNFTGMSEALTPNQVVTLLNEYFTAMLEVIVHFQISVDKFIGDGILAYVDPGDSQVQGAEQENRLAVDASLAMIDAVKKLNVKLLTLGLPDIKIGVGIYRGPVVIGLIGSDAKLQHTIIGDTVNRTARLEGLCKELGVSIVISEQVWSSLEDERKARFQSYGKQSVKGIALPIEVFGS